MSRWRVALRAAFLVFGLASLSTPAEAQYFGQNKVQYRTYDWKSIASDHFEVYFYPGSDSLAMRVLDLSEKANAMFSARLGHTLSKRIPIILYGSHNDFSQTNVTPGLIDGSTGGFTELLRDRVVIPFTGSYEDLRHVLVHELAHAFQFDILYNGTGSSLITGQGFFQLPLWFAEGMAEYFSQGVDSETHMFVGDGTLTGYVPPIEYAGGFLVYKVGQSAVAYLIERFGEERFRDVLKRSRQMRSFDRAFQRVYGLPVGKFDEQWREWARKRYWPTIAQHEQPERYGRRLTDHRRDESNLNFAPAVSPQGDRVAYFSDRKQYTDVYLLSAHDGKVIRRVIRGERNTEFEQFPLLRTSITWSPDGRYLALAAKAGGRDRLYQVDAESGRITRRFDLPCESLAFPSWSPSGDSIVVSGLRDGRSDLYLVETRSGRVERLTDDAWDEKESAWAPDGRSIVFASDRLAPVVLRPLKAEDGYGRYGIYRMDLGTRAVERVLDTSGEDRQPVWSPDGRRLAFISDRNGAPNMYLYDSAAGSITQLTDVLGGVFSLSWSRQNDRLVFSAFNRGGWDLFAVQEPLSLDPVVDRLRDKNPSNVLSIAEAARPVPPDTVRATTRGALAMAWPDTVVAPDTSLARGGRGLRGGRPRFDPVAFEPPAWDRADLRGVAMTPEPDSAKPVQREVRTPLLERGGPFALSDSVLGQRPSGYRWRLSPEYVNGGFLAATGYGFVGSSQIVFSDFLGDRSVLLATDVFSSSLEETNALLLYNYLPRRWDFGGGVFHFKNYFSSRVTTLGEALGSPKTFSERTFGGLASMSYPFDRFRRLDLEFTQQFVERAFYERDVFGTYFIARREYRSVTTPSVSWVGDNSLSGPYGPVNGSRYNLTLAPGFSLFPNGLSFQTATVDFRRYWDLTHDYTFAFRMLDGASTGRDPQTFRVGGFSTIRGFSDFDLLGTRIALINTELRFPFIQQLGLVGPLPLGIFNLKGAAFADAGLVWSEGEKLRLSHIEDGARKLDSPYLGFGVGIRSYLLFGLMKLDVAWATDLHGVAQPRWHFSIGPEF